MFCACVYFQNHFDKSRSFKTEKDARRWLDLEAAYTDNVQDYKLYKLNADGWRLVDAWRC